MTVSSNKRLRWCKTFPHVQQLFVCGPGAENLFTVSIAVSLSSLLYMKETFGWLKAANLPGATEGLVVAAKDQSESPI